MTKTLGKELDMARTFKSTKPFVCLECGKQLTYGQAKAAEYRGCPKCGGSDIDANVAIVVPVKPRAMIGATTTTAGA
jgi:predicted RNA-binding Zn-ribbon protein involved in translation (DUF1610 family)